MADVLEEVSLQNVEEYIRRRRNTVAEFIATCPLFANYWEGKQLWGFPRHLFWWKQEFDTDLEDLILDPRSDGSTASVGALES